MLSRESKYARRCVPLVRFCGEAHLNVQDALVEARKLTESRSSQVDMVRLLGAASTSVNNADKDACLRVGANYKGEVSHGKPIGKLTYAPGT